MGKTCAFLGNDYDFMRGRKRERRPRFMVKEQVKEQIVKLIETEGVTDFLVGEIGGYEEDAYDAVLEVKQNYPDIHITLVISKITELHPIGEDNPKHVYAGKYCDDFIYPDKSAMGYKRLSIVYRNRFIIENTDFIIAYNEYQGRAYEFCKKARNKGVKIIELSEIYN